MTTTTDPATAERLEFSWHRSGLAFAAIGLAIARRSIPSRPTRPTQGAVLLSVGIALTIAAVASRAVAHHQPPAQRTQLRLATGAALLIGVVAFISGAAP